MTHVIEFAQIDNAQIHYESAGTGETVVFLHSGMTDSRMWDTQWTQFTQEFHCIRYDRPGYGQSPKTEDLRVHRRDLFHLLNQLGCEQVHLVGCSMGGEIAADFALEYPEKVLSVTLISSVLSGFEMQGEPPQELGEMIAALQSGNVQAATAITNRMYLIGARRTEAQVKSDLQAQIKVMTALIIENGAIMLPDAEPLNPPAMQRLSTLTVPALLIVGADDHPEILRAADVFVEQLPDAQKAIIDNSAHFPNMERATEFNQVLLSFLRGA